MSRTTFGDIKERLESPHNNARMDDVAIFVTNLYYLVVAVRHSCTTAFPLIVSWHGLVFSNK